LNPDNVLIRFDVKGNSDCTFDKQYMLSNFWRMKRRLLDIK